MGVIAEGILRGCQGLFTPVSLGYPLSVFNKNSTLKHITVAAKNIHNHGPHRGLRRILKIWPSTTADQVVSCVHNSLLTQRCDASMVIFGISKNVVCVCESSTRQSAICLNCNPTTRHLLWKKTRIPLRFRWEKAPKYLENCKDT